MCRIAQHRDQSGAEEFAMLHVLKICRRCPYWTEEIDGGILLPLLLYLILDQATNSNGAICCVRPWLRLRRLDNHYLRVLRRDIRHVNHELSSMSHNVRVQPRPLAGVGCDALLCDSSCLQACRSVAS